LRNDEDDDVPNFLVLKRVAVFVPITSKII